MRVGDVLDAKILPLDDKKMREVFATAQGEIAIESFLSKLKAFWETYPLSFSVYKGKCRLIRGAFIAWEVLRSSLGKYCARGTRSTSARLCAS
jgi:hypothetical protein